MFLMGLFPATPLLSRCGNAVMQQEVGHKAGHLAEEAGQATLADMQARQPAFAGATISAPVDATLSDSR